MTTTRDAPSETRRACAKCENIAPQRRSTAARRRGWSRPRNSCPSASSRQRRWPLPLRTGGVSAKSWEVQFGLARYRHKSARGDNGPARFPSKPGPLCRRPRCPMPTPPHSDLEATRSQPPYLGLNQEPHSMFPRTRRRFRWSQPTYLATSVGRRPVWVTGSTVELRCMPDTSSRFPMCLSAGRRPARRSDGEFSV